MQPMGMTDVPADEDIYSRDLLAFYVNLSCLLKAMAENALEMKRSLKGRANVAEAFFEAGEYRIDVICRNNGVRPFLASMKAPAGHSAYLGRLTKDGKVHMFAHGVKVFFDQLLEENIAHAFRRDLENALDAFLAPKAPADATRLATGEDTVRADESAPRATSD